MKFSTCANFPVEILSSATTVSMRVVASSRIHSSQPNDKNLAYTVLQASAGTWVLLPSLNKWNNTDAAISRYFYVQISNATTAPSNFSHLGFVCKFPNKCTCTSHFFDEAMIASQRFLKVCNGETKRTELAGVHREPRRPKTLLKDRSWISTWLNRPNCFQLLFLMFQCALSQSSWRFICFTVRWRCGRKSDCRIEGSHLWELSQAKQHSVPAFSVVSSSPPH